MWGDRDRYIVTMEITERPCLSIQIREAREGRKSEERRMIASLRGVTWRGDSESDPF
jgi:hypothetical protein